MDNDLKKKIRFKKIRNRVIIAIVVIGIAAAVFFSWKKSAAGKELVFDTEEISKGSIEATVSSTGSLSPVTTVDVGSQVSGTILEIYVDYNDRVRTGQTLARIDPSIYETQQEQAAARLNSARAQYNNAMVNLEKSRISVQNAQSGIYKAQSGVDQARAGLEEARSQLIAAEAKVRQAKAQKENDAAEFERAQELFKRDLISRSELEKADTLYQVSKGSYESAKAGLKSAEARIQASRSNLESAKSSLQAAISTKQAEEASVRSAQNSVQQAQATIDQAQGDLAQVEVNLGRTIIKSPIDGIVIDRRVEPGQTVAASFQTPVLFSLAKNLNQMEVKAAVDEADIGKVSEEQEVKFTVDAFPDDEFKGKIHQVRSSPTTEQNVVTYDVIIRTKNDDLKLKPGMTANIDITVEVKEDVLKLPNAALRFRPSRYPTFPYPDDVKKEMEEALNKQDKPETGDKEKKKDDNGEGKDRGKGKKDGEAPEQEIWILVDGKPQRFKVKTGISNFEFTEILSGEVKEDQEAITGAATKAEREQEKNKRRMRVRL